MLNSAKEQGQFRVGKNQHQIAALDFRGCKECAGTVTGDARTKAFGVAFGSTGSVERNFSRRLKVSKTVLITSVKERNGCEE